ncbi:hypothetical protein [Natrinema versiforme]|uniref:Uncharacterized protein n=1 Tax=Natrinema versiforme JCM 10478 TaxID=1227496 RepID=L9Y7F8_9EURY|nr:hypothetical protein [Natrinema versiforme]ELY68873.1 hypothetical protein C489_05888 [Natrinema versiforme JCM 10478]
MATTQTPTTDAPTLPTNTHPWPAFDREHDPDYLAENDPTETERTTLADFGGIEPSEPERATIPIDDRETTRQTSVFEFPTAWWTDADRLETLFDERDLALGEISNLFGDDRCYEVVRSQLNELGVRDPDTDGAGMAAFLENASPGDVGDPLPDAFQDDDGGASA